MLRGGVRVGREEGRVRARIPSPCYSWGASPPRLCPPPPPPGSQGSPKAGEPRMGSRLGADYTHWRRSRRTPSSSDTSSAGCGWAWLGRRLGLSRFFSRCSTPCPPRSETLLTPSRLPLLRSVLQYLLHPLGIGRGGSAVSLEAPGVLSLNKLNPEVPPPKCPSQKQ